MDASTHGSYGMGGGGALVVSPDCKCLYTVLIFVHSFDGVRHAGCVGVWSGGARSRAVRVYETWAAFSAPTQSFLHSLHAHALTLHSMTDKGNAA